MKSTNRRLWSLPGTHGINCVVSYATPTAGVVRTVTQLELDLCDDCARIGLAIYLMGSGSPLSATLAPEQFAHG